MANLAIEDLTKSTNIEPLRDIENEIFDAELFKTKIIERVGEKNLEAVLKGSLTGQYNLSDLIDERKKIYKSNNYATMSSYIEQILDYAIETGLIEEM